MPPRSYYNSPRTDDYLSFAEAFFPNDAHKAKIFSEQLGLPYIQTELHLAAYLGISPSLIRQILYRKHFHYRFFEIDKRNGKSRRISTPKTYLKVIQWWVNDNIFSRISAPDCVHGFCVGRSYITNARHHVGANHILNVDIEKFFPSITENMIFEVFRSLGYDPSGAALLAGLTSLFGSAPTGAPTSPLIGNIILREFDVEVEALARSNQIKYTRYADDLTFSSLERIEDSFLKDVISHVEKCGFVLNRSKTRFMGRGDRMDVTGLVVNSDPNLPYEWRNRARGYLHRVIMNPGEYVARYSEVAGIFGVLKSLDPNLKKPLTRQAANAMKALGTS